MSQGCQGGYFFPQWLGKSKKWTGDVNWHCWRWSSLVRSCKVPGSCHDPICLVGFEWIKELRTNYENNPPEETVIWKNYRKSSLLDKNVFQSSGGLGFAFFFLKGAENRNTTCSQRLYSPQILGMTKFSFLKRITSELKLEIWIFTVLPMLWDLKHDHVPSQEPGRDKLPVRFWTGVMCW